MFRKEYMILDENFNRFINLELLFFILFGSQFIPNSMFGDGNCGKI